MGLADPFSLLVYLCKELRVSDDFNKPRVCDDFNELRVGNNFDKHRVCNDFNKLRVGDEFDKPRRFADCSNQVFISASNSGSSSISFRNARLISSLL